MSFQDELAESERIERESVRAERTAKRGEKDRIKAAALLRSAESSYRDATLADAARSGLNVQDLKSMRCTDFESDWGAANLGLERAGYVLPYHNLDGKAYDPPFERCRITEIFNWDNDPKKLRYRQPKDTGVRGYFSRRVKWRDVLADVSIPITITEGEKKCESACKAGIVTVGLGGVWNQLRDGELLEELPLLAAGGRRINICFDSDRATNRDIQHAEVTLALRLRAAGARVFIAALKSNGTAKVAMDDLLLTKRGRKILETALTKAVEFAGRDVVTRIRATDKSNDARHRKIADAVKSELLAGGDFIYTPDGLWYFDRSGNKTLVPLDHEQSVPLRAFLEKRVDVTGGHQEWPITFNKLRNTAQNDGRRAKVYKLAHYNAETRTWYRAQSASKIIRATVAGWEIMDNGTDDVLIHTRAQMEDVEISRVKASRQAFDAVASIPNFIDGHVLTAKQAALLWRIYIVSLNFPDLHPTRPIPLFHGPKGASKTSAGRGVLRTEFGSLGQVTSINPNKLDALESVVINDAIAVLDNIDGRHEELQNVLACCATGGVLKMRRLYTTGDQAAFKIDCFPIVTSRDPKSFVRDDVVDRLLYFPVDRRDDFMPEGELIALIDANRAKYWRWLLDTMPAIIRAVSGGKAGAVYSDRMADFTRFALAVGPVLGYSLAEVRGALAAMGAEKLHFQSEYSSLLAAIEMYVSNMNSSVGAYNGEEKGYSELIDRIRKPMTAAELLAAIKTVKADFAYTNARSFGQALRNEATALEAKFRFKIAEDRKAKVKTYSIEPATGFPTWAEHEKARKQAVADEKG